MNKDIEEYFKKSSKIERAKENAFLKKAYRELATEDADMCDICHKYVDDIDSHRETVHGGKQKTLFEMYAEEDESYGDQYTTGGWDELDPKRYPHAKAPRGHSNDELNVTQDLTEEDLLTSDPINEYTSAVPTDNEKHQTQNLQNSIENDDEGNFYTHDGQAEDGIPFYRTPEDYYTDKGDEGTWDEIEQDDDLVPLDQFDGEEDVLQDKQREEIDTLRKYGVSDKTLHLDMGYNKSELHATEVTVSWKVSGDTTQTNADWQFEQLIPIFGGTMKASFKDTATGEFFFMAEFSKEREAKEWEDNIRSMQSEFGVKDISVESKTTEGWDEDESERIAANLKFEDSLISDRDVIVTLTNMGFTDKQARRALKKASEGAYGSGRRGHKKWMKDAELVETVDDEDLRRENFIARAEEILFDALYASEGDDTMVYPKFEEGPAIVPVEEGLSDYLEKMADKVGVRMDRYVQEPPREPRDNMEFPDDIAEEDDNF